VHLDARNSHGQMSPGAESETLELRPGGRLVIHSTHLDQYGNQVQAPPRVLTTRLQEATHRPITRCTTQRIRYTFGRNFFLLVHLPPTVPQTIRPVSKTVDQPTEDPWSTATYFNIRGCPRDRDVPLSATYRRN